MGRVSSFFHQGVPMVLIDFSGLGPREILATVAPAAAEVRSNPPKSVFTITKVDGASFDSDVITAVKELAKGNDPHVRAAAIVGLTGMQRIVLSSVSYFTGRSFLTCTTVEEAKSRLLASV